MSNLSKGQFSAQEVIQGEKSVLAKLQWKLQPVSPYELAADLIVYAKVGDRTKEDALIQHTSSLLNFAICTPKTLLYTRSTLAIAAAVCAHELLSLCPQQLLNAVEDLMNQVEVPFPAAQQIRCCQEQVQENLVHNDADMFQCLHRSWKAVCSIMLLQSVISNL